MINVIGLGYIGLPTALMLSASGNEVVGTDYNTELVRKLEKGVVTFKEDGLEKLFSRAISNGICFDTEYRVAEVYIVSVPTPYDEESKKVDAHYIEIAISRILGVCPDGAIIVVESTISPGTIDNHVRPLIKGKKVNLVHAPERIIPGNMINELINNNRTIGADSKEVGNYVKDIYQSFCKGEIEVTDIRTAEMTKVVENTFRDINIAYANELAKICRHANLNVYEIIRIANKHPRVNILTPGPGVGGHCISVDPWFLVGDYPGLANIILAARKINDSMPEFVLSRVREVMDEKMMNDVSKVGFYGITYKENVDDIRESPTLQLMNCMKNHLCGENVQLYDPMVRNKIFANQHESLDSFLNSIDLLVIMVGHDELLQNLEKLKNKVILDTKNVCGIEGVYHL